MTPNDNHWQHLGGLFDELVELTPAQRDVRLVAIARDDATLANELRGMLHADELASGVLDRGIVAVAPTMIHELGGEDSDEPMEEAPPPQIGRFRLLRLIGRGGMGEVYLAERSDGDFVQQVALKLLKRGMDSDELLRRFVQERRILAQLNHPHIARLVDGGVSDDGRPYYAMEYVEGVMLTDYARDHALDVRERVRLMVAVCEAVAHAQTRLVVHRDLKPSNLLVDATGAPRVLDFGIAKLLSDTEERLTRTGVRALSPAYAAPEQVLGEPVSTATDVYALGVVLYELLSGRLPHRRDGAPEMLARTVTQETVERPSAALRDADATSVTQTFGTRSVERDRQARAISGDLDTIVLTALKREPERRYANAAALADDLGRWLDGRPIQARADSAAYRTSKFIRRHRVGVAATTLVALSLIGGLGAALWQARIARVAAATATAANEQAQHQAAVATAVSDFLLQDVIAAANPYRNKLDLSLRDALLKGAERVGTRFAAQPRLEGIVRLQIAESLMLAGELAPAETQARLAFDRLVATFGAYDADALEARALLGHILVRLDHEPEATALYSAVTDRARVPAKPRLRIAIGEVEIDIENRREVEALAAIDVAMPDVVGEFGEFSEEHLRLYGARLKALVNTDRYPESLVVVRELVAGSERAFGAEDPRTLDALKRESIVLRQLHRNEEALPVAQRAARIAVDSLGPDHPATVDTQIQVGIALFELKRFDEALPILEKALEGRKRLWGETSEITLTTTIWYARVHQRLGHLAKARELFEHVNATAIATLGEDTANALPFAQTLGMFLEQTGQHADAERRRRDLLARAERVLPTGHVNIAKYAWDVGETLASSKQDAALVEFYARWLPDWKRLFGEADDRVVDAQRWLAEAQQRLAATKR